MESVLVYAKGKGLQLDERARIIKAGKQASMCINKQSLTLNRKYINQKSTLNCFALKLFSYNGVNV